MNYRIARDFVAAEEEEKKKDDKEGDEDDKAAEDEGGEVAANDKSIKTMDASPKDEDKKSGENDQKEGESKHNRSWNLLIKPDKWENIYGIENVTMKDAELKASFEEGDFRSTVKLKLSAELKLGDGTLKVKGQISRDDNFLEAEISGQKLPEKETKKPDDEKKEDEKKTAGVGSLTFASEGVAVQGGISDVRIPDTEITIKKAGLEIFFGFKSKKNEEKPDEKSGNDKKDSKPTGESKPEVLGKDQDGEVAEKSLVKSSDKSSAKTPSEKKEKDHKTKKVKRGSRFGILGVVKINKVDIKVDIKVGLYTEQKKDKEKREWLTFGAIENVRLREIWNDIPEDNFLNLELRNIALIASSHERKKKKKDDKKEDADGNEKKKKTDGDKEKSDEVKPKAITNEVSDGKVWINSLDVLKVAEEEKPDKDLKEEERDEDKDKEEEDEDEEEEKKEPDNWDVLGTVDAYNYPVVKVATFGYCIPPQLWYYYRHQVVYGARIEHPRNIDFGLQGLRFHFCGGSHCWKLQGCERRIASLVACCDDALLTACSGSEQALHMRLFSLLDQRQVDIGKFRAKLDMGLRPTSAEVVFQLEMNKLDAMEITQLAGVLIDNQAMQQMKGKMWCFGKKGEFDGRFDENGVVIKAGIDNFKVGGLEITSTREGVDRATMDIEMTKDRQKLFIDGRIRYHSLEISVFLDLDIQEQYLKVDIKIKLTESLLLSLKADVVVKNHNSLEGAEMSFEAILETDILGVILQGIMNGIDALHKLADKAIEDARSDLTTKLAQKKAALKAMKSELDKLEKKRTAKVLRKRDEIDKENELLRGLHDEFGLEKTRYDWKRNCEWNLNHCAWYDKAYWVAKLTEATLGLEEAHARKAIDAELRHAGKTIMDLPAFRSIEVAIKEAARKIDQFGRALDGLVNRGLAAWIDEMLKAEREDLNRQIRLLEALLRKREELEAAYEQAKKDLDKTEERLSPKQEAARKRIAEIEGEIKMLPAQHEYMNKKKDYENMEIQVNHLIATLDDIRRVMEEVSQISKDVLNTLKKGIPRVTKIIVRASNRTFADDKPLMFEIQAVWMDKHETFRVEWAPNQGISVLYSQAAEKLATWGHEDEPPALLEPEPEPTPQPDPTPQDPKPEPEPEPEP
ncbi:hypothetical protein FOC1_g10006542 [Fusarium oxysporum f. sp. cubense race 1]|uniref:Uncharacterized protein n=1 Tax=Fusarium oxysporum f. sp. cubense (strain race 1) TaxID=1229664 RepID=N4UAG5_FUSC1|nr:hypothetical protein FOC1_g10006542 [Fusarium oxysporum f. sp. cubense race 1]